MKIISLGALIAPGALAAAGPYLAGGETCAEMQPICFSGDYKFKFDKEKASTSTAWRSDRRSDFGCLSSSPGEQWFYFTTDEAGSATFDMKSYRDHDYAIWGPYNSLNEAKSRCGNTGAPADCSYSGTAHEFANVANVQQGNFYTLLVTNYAKVTQELVVRSQGVKISCDAVETRYQTEKTAWEAAGAPQEVMAGNPTPAPTRPPTTPVCEYTDNAGGDACAHTSSKCNDVGAEGDAIRKMCGYTCRSSEYMGTTTDPNEAGVVYCITSSAPTNQPTSKPTKSPTVPPTQAPSRRPHVASGRSNDHSGEYHEDNFDCYYKNCQEWDCAMWCKCFEQETEDADLYADSGCEDDGDNSCECVENVLGLHETEDNWDFVGEASAKPDQTKPHYKNIVVGKGENNFAETVKTFKRPFILDVWMKQDLDQEAAGYQTVPAPGNVFVFPQNTDSGCSGYCMGINQLGSAAYNFVDPMANDYFYFAGRDSEYQQRKNKLNGNQTSVNEHELWQKLTIKFSLQGGVAYYFNAEKNPRFETHDTTYMDGKIRLGKNVANYRYHSPQLTKGARDASVNIAPWRRLGSEYEEYWGEQYRTQWD